MTIIKSKLLESAQKYVATLGMKKTSLDQITADAGISKPMFYKFYQSKEHLFLDIVTLWHTEMTQRSLAILEQHSDLTMKERAGICILEIINYINERSMVRFFDEDVPQIIRKIPESAKQVAKEHDSYLIPVLESTGLRFSISPDTVAAIIHILLFSAKRKEDVGEYYDEAITIMVQAIMSRIIEE